MEATIQNLAVAIWRAVLIGGILGNFAVWSVIFGRWIAKKTKQYKFESRRLQQEAIIAKQGVKLQK